MESEEKKEYTLEDFRNEIAEIAKKKENLGDFPEAINSEDLTSADMKMWARVKDKSITKNDIDKYTELFEKERGFENKSRNYFMMFLRGKAHFVINQESEDIKNKKVFIELGAGNIPVSWVGKREFKENEIYIGIDRASGDLEEARERTREDREENTNTHFVQADIRKLPVSDHAADEVFLGNVLGDPSIKDAEKDKFIEEAKRILKKGGKIIIEETYTPPNFKWIDDFIKRHGLFVEKGADSGNQKWKETVDPYNKIGAKYKWSGSYIVFLKPEENGG